MYNSKIFAFKNIKRNNILPGFGLSLGVIVTYISLLLLIPVATIFIQASSLKFSEFINIITSPRVVESYKLSFGAAFIAALFNCVMGFVVAWVIVRYDFPGKKIIDALVDLPFALPTAVAGISLTTIFAKEGFAGKYLNSIGIEVAFTPLGVIVALVFVGIPFVIRVVQPVIKDLDKELEEAAESLNATRYQIFRKVIFPEVKPALISGFTMAFARGLGEYGSVIFISGNMPMKTEIAPLLIVTKLEQYDYSGATAIAAVLLSISFVILFLINLIQTRAKNKLN